MESLLKKFFGFYALRPYQSDVINQVIHNRDCIVVMATGAGKSLCYQLPPLVTSKTCIVVSPLLSLMQDQVMSLNQKGVKADYLGSTQTNPHVTRNAANGYYNVLYMTPERAMALTKNFWTKMLACGVCLFAVDEAHCISEWGHDFRVEYKRLHLLRHSLPGVPFLALTATATERVRADIKESLALKEPYVHIGSFDRPNLFYGVKLIKGPGRSSSFINNIIKDVTRRVSLCESTIIYCATVRDTEQVHEDLNSNGVSSCIYHGQMDSLARELSHKAFVTDEVRVMVATIAFGMGIDKPDVRCVIHFGCPKSLESYYQESGRCGRDGQPSICWLYYHRSDFTRGDFYCAEKSEAQKTAIMNSFIAGQKYCTLASCRRQNLLNYFGEDTGTTCGNCDICTASDIKEKDLTSESILLLSSIKYCGSRWGFNLPINVLRGSKSKKIISHNFHDLPIHGLGKEYTLQWWKALGCILLEHAYLHDSVNSTFRVISLSEKGYNYLNESTRGNYPLVFKLSPDMINEEEDSLSGDDVIEDVDSMFCDHASLCNEEMQVYQMLVEVRKKLADDYKAAPYAICGDQVLRSIAISRPSTRENLALVDGVNLYFITHFGAIIIDCVKDISEELNLCLDNITIGEAIYDTEESFVQGDYNDMSFEDMKQSIASFVSSNDGVPLSSIIANFSHAAEDFVIATVVDLETDFEIYKKNGLYFPG